MEEFETVVCSRFGEAHHTCEFQLPGPCAADPKHCTEGTVRTVQPGQGKTNEEALAIAISLDPQRGSGALSRLQDEAVGEVEENEYPYPPAQTRKEHQNERESQADNVHEDHINSSSPNTCP